MNISLSSARARKLTVGIGVVATITAALLSLAILRVPTASANLIDTAAQGQQESDGPVADVVIDSTGGGSTVLVVGDSHANFWRQGFAAYAKEKGFSVCVCHKAQLSLDGHSGLGTQVRRHTFRLPAKTLGAGYRCR